MTHSQKLTLLNLNNKALLFQVLFFVNKLLNINLL
jgi:hypothetical protein